VNANNDHACFLEFLMQALDSGKFGETGRAPNGPEIKQDDLTFQ